MLNIGSLKEELLVYLAQTSCLKLSGLRFWALQQLPTLFPMAIPNNQTETTLNVEPFLRIESSNILLPRSSGFVHSAPQVDIKLL